MLQRTKNVHQENHVDQPIVLDLPMPPSVNATRKVNWAARPRVEKWVNQCDLHFILRKHKIKGLLGRYEIKIVYDEKRCRIDPDNGVKVLQDLCKRYALIVDDSKKFCRRIVVEFGEAPEGCRVILNAVE